MVELSDLIKRIKPRPELYIGCRSINCLRVYLDGFSQALSLVKHETSLGEELVEFQNWLASKYGITTSQSWNQILLFFSANEDSALDLFFKMYAEFHERPQLERED